MKSSYLVGRGYSVVVKDFCCEVCTLDGFSIFSEVKLGQNTNCVPYLYHFYTHKGYKLIIKKTGSHTISQMSLVLMSVINFSFPFYHNSFIIIKFSQTIEADSSN